MWHKIFILRDLDLIRHQVSEGIDFSDDACRMCIVVGIPYPSSKDLQVQYTLDGDGLESVHAPVGRAFLPTSPKRIDRCCATVPVRNLADMGAVLGDRSS